MPFFPGSLYSRGVAVQNEFSGWVYPVPIWKGREPKISDGWGSPRPGIEMGHRGVDIMYPRHEGEPKHAPYGSARHVMFPNVPALAACDGIVEKSYEGKYGHAVVLNHGKWFTYYTHMANRLVQKGDKVRAGQALGTISGSPTESGKGLKHLHFEMWLNGKKAVDPERYIKKWPKVTMDGDRIGIVPFIPFIALGIIVAILA